MTDRREIKPLVMHVWGIANQDGSVWSRRVFDTQDDAARYLHDTARFDPNYVEDFRVIPVTVTVEARILSA